MKRWEALNTKVYSYIEQQKMLTDKEGVVIGLSGGADSVGLFRFFVKNHAPDLLCAVHVHHGIRGEEADRDAHFCENLAREFHVPFRLVTENVNLRAKEWNMSIEEAGRKIRYESMEQIRQELQFSYIAVAHHGDDQAETILFQMARGSGLKGLGGMRGKSGTVIRPFLCLSHTQICEALQEIGQTWCEDSTNTSLDYRRNRIRNQILPLLEQVQSGATQHMNNTAQQLQSISEYIEKQTWLRYKEIVTESYVDQMLVLSIDCDGFLQTEKALQTNLILLALEKVCASRKDIGTTHVENVLRLFSMESGKRISLPYDMEAGRDYGHIWIRKRMTKPLSKYFLWEMKSEILERNQLPEIIPKKNCTKWFDYAKICCDPAWRYPAEGDYMTIDLEGHKKSIRRLMIDAKLPRDERETAWVLAEGNHVLWCPVLDRVSMYYYVGEHTQKVWVLSMIVKGEKV